VDSPAAPELGEPFDSRSSASWVSVLIQVGWVARTEAGADGAAAWRMVHWPRRSMEQPALSVARLFKGWVFADHQTQRVSSAVLRRGSFGTGVARQSNERLERSRGSGH